MSPFDVEGLARELLSAHNSGEMITVPPSSRPGFDLDAAYAVEGILKNLRETAGHQAVGRKVGYANKAMWRVLKLETLVWAHMYDDTVHYAGDDNDNDNKDDENSCTLSVAHPRSLKVEPEIIFGLKRSFTPTATATDPQKDAATAALESTAWIAVGFEIIDCPYPDWKFQPSDFVASYGLHAALVVGHRAEIQPEQIAALVEELPRLKVRVSKNGEFVEEGSGRNSLKSPALCLAELGAAVARRSPTQSLQAGEIVSSGTLTAGHLATAGDLWKVEVEGLSLLSLPPLTLRLA